MFSNHHPNTDNKFNMFSSNNHSKTLGNHNKGHSQINNTPQCIKDSCQNRRDVDFIKFANLKFLNLVKIL